MKLFYGKFISMALIAGMTLFTACDDEENGGNGGDGDYAATLSGDVTEDVTLTSGNTYELNGSYTVKDGATLTIEPGVKIVAVYDDIVDYILVEQGGKINAVGTADAPIVMTSEQEMPGSWGGIHICGKAPINVEGGTGLSEIGEAVYGGNENTDNSGTLKYVRVEYTGYAFNDETESNGITFYGVGSGTDISYCQAYRGKDDGFEFFGGTVNVSNMVVISCGDDSFDWTEGWTGRGDNWIAVQEEGEDCDCLIEADNNSNDFAASPVSHPVLSNLLLVGNGGDAQGVRLRAGTQVEIDKAIVCGKALPLTVETTETENALKDGTSKLSNIQLSGVLASENGIYTNDDFTADGNNNQVNQTFDAFTYESICEDYAWVAGWTHSWGDGGSTSEEVAGELSGDLTGEMTLAAGSTYMLNGEYHVKAGATLNIEEGVTIISIYDDITDYILVEQGGKINAVGTADAPIVMTAQDKKAGAWGGIHICGNAPINVLGGTGSSEIGGASYGGSTANDNSGTLQYVRVEYTGYSLNEETESNGISFYGVGNGTTVNHCVAANGKDDGFEFFGGTVNISNMVVIDCGDDSFDWTEGWSGRGTNLVAYQSTGNDCDCLIEADNNGTDFGASPVSHPTLSNLVLVGNGGDAQGVRLRAGTQVTMDNARICGKALPLTVETSETENALKDGTSKLTNVTISAEMQSKEGIYTPADFLAGEGNKVDAGLAYADFNAVKEACDWLDGAWIGE